MSRPDAIDLNITTPCSHSQTGPCNFNLVTDGPTLNFTTSPALLVNRQSYSESVSIQRQVIYLILHHTKDFDPILSQMSPRDCDFFVRVQLSMPFSINPLPGLGFGTPAVIIKYGLQ
jgi:hypothetical protein